MTVCNLDLMSLCYFNEVNDTDTETDDDDDEDGDGIMIGVAWRSGD